LEISEQISSWVIVLMPKDLIFITIFYLGKVLRNGYSHLGF